MIRANLEEEREHLSVIVPRNGCEFTLTKKEWDTVVSAGGSSSLPAELR